MMNPILKWLRVATSKTGHGLITDSPKPPENMTTEQYFGTWLPGEMGKYLGRLHKNGISAQMAHTQNWSAVGTLYDISSNFTPTNKESFLRDDIRYTYTSINSLLNPQLGNYLETNFPELAWEAKRNFLQSYYQERFQRNITAADLIDLYKTTLLKNEVIRHIAQYHLPGSGLPEAKYYTEHSEEIVEKIAIPLGISINRKQLGNSIF